jgi:hypothetical protein
MPHSLYRPSFEETTELLRPKEIYREGDPRTQYWKKHGIVHFHEHVVPHSDSGSFVFYLSGIAADQNHCFYNGRRKASLEPTSLKSYSFAYFGDAHTVRTLTAEVKGAHVSTFRALDSGIRTIPGGAFPFILIASGYAKDSGRAYFCDGGNAMHIAKADPSSFEALADEFGADARHVFWGRASLPKADRRNWRRLAGGFSTDGVRVYCNNRIIEGADAETFTVFANSLDHFSYATDKNYCYAGDRRITRTEFEQSVGDG